MLATAGQNGVTRSLLVAHGVGVPKIANLVNQKLADLTFERSAGRRQGEVANPSILKPARFPSST